jgi:putative selenate reductase
MVEFVPLPFETLVRRALREVDRCEAIFDLPLSKCFFGSAAHDFSVTHLGRRAASPLGPAAGPHSQMAQNIVLAWLGGSRFIELKTVQVLDELVIARPCIDMRTVGYNIEWSQELKIEQSIGEYVKAAMLIEILKVRLGDRLQPGFLHTLYDMSVGYDLEGIRSPSVRRFLGAMRDCREWVERFRDEIPGEYSAYRELPFPERISDTLTLSTFHGCPPDEIERILEHLLREQHLNVIVKLNPTLLGADEVDRLLHDVLGYESIRVPAGVYARDTRWDQAVGFISRLRTLARDLGLGFGAKLTNTLVVEHEGEFIPATEKEKYLSGAPLHVLAMQLVGRMRTEFGAEFPLSFSAGIDRHNFADAVALGLVPVTVCTDLLRTGGYARQAAYYRELMQRMDAVSATDIEGFLVAEAGGHDLPQAILANTERYVAAATASARYRLEQNRKPPKKIGSTLELFDCITCDKCIPVCPNDANFALPLAPVEIPVWHHLWSAGRWTSRAGEPLRLEMQHQIAQFADFCNDCGNCDVFCPEDGGPYLVKPRFFGSEAQFEKHVSHDGFFVRVVGDAVQVRGRFEGREFELELTHGLASYSGDGFEVEFSVGEPSTLRAGRAEPGTLVDLTYALIMDHVQRSLLDGVRVNYVNAAQ